MKTNSFAQYIVENYRIRIDNLVLDIIIIFGLIAIFLAIIILIRIRETNRHQLSKLDRYNKDLQELSTMITSFIIKINDSMEFESHSDLSALSIFAGKLAKKMQLDKNIINEIKIYAALHDIGKMKISNSIWSKPARLTEIEFEISKSHTILGSEIVNELNFGKVCSNIAKYHHENWDGTGYNQLSGTDIPVEARIVNIVDVYDALRTKRPYKKAWSHQETLEYIKLNSGTLFQPKLVKYFLSIEKEIHKVYT